MNFFLAFIVRSVMFMAFGAFRRIGKKSLYNWNSLYEFAGGLPPTARCAQARGPRPPGRREAGTAEDGPCLCEMVKLSCPPSGWRRPLINTGESNLRSFNMKQDTTEPRRQRLKRIKRAWPLWLRSKRLIRWLFYVGPLIYRIFRAVRMLFNTEGG